MKIVPDKTRVRVALAVAWVGIQASFLAFAQPSDTPRDETWVTNGPVYAIARTTDTVYIGGDFTRVGRCTGSWVPIGTGTGQPVGTFPKVNGWVRACVSDNAGGWYIGGCFWSVGGVARNNIAHILANGAVDPAWDPNANDEVHALAVSGSTVYAAGAFWNIGGQRRVFIAALDAVTGTATDWDPDADGVVKALAVSGSTVYAGGWFGRIGGQWRNCIAALDASTGSATAWDPSASSDVNALAVSGSTVYAGGYFTSIGGEERSCIAALDAATGIATAWNPNAQGDWPSDTIIYALAVCDSTVYAGGRFKSIGGQTRNYIAALDAATGAATPWNPSADDCVYALSVSDSTLYAGGRFTKIGGRPRNYIAALDAATGAATPWNPSADDCVYALSVSDSTVYAGGKFTGLGWMWRYYIAALDAATGAATTWNPHASYIVLALTVSGSTVYAGGWFMYIGGQTRNRIAALDAATGTATDWNPNADGGILALSVSGVTVYAGGGFTCIGGQARNHIAALDAATGNATAWNPNANSRVLALAVSGSTVYVGGGFTSIGGQARSRIAALDAATGTATAWNPNVEGLYRWVTDLAVSGSTVYTGGYFGSIGGQARNNIAALDAATGAATAWNPNAQRALYSEVLALSVSGSTVYAGGRFTNIGGQERNNIAALDAATGNATAWNPSVTGGDYPLVNALAVSGSTLYAGGDFTSIGGDVRLNFAEFGPAPTPMLQTVADNQDGTAHVTWTNPSPPPAQFLGFAWDIYADDWVNRGWSQTMWFPYPAQDTEGDLDLGFSGGYHLWISNHYPDGSWFPCPNPWSGFQWSGTPHTPLDVSVEDLGARRVRLHWRPDRFGTWHWEMIVWQAGVGFIPVPGPSGNALWHFVDYCGAMFTPGQADFFAGWADFTLPADGAYWIFLRAAGWLPPYDPPVTGEYGSAFIPVVGE